MQSIAIFLLWTAAAILGRWVMHQEEKENAKLTEEERNERWWDNQW